MKRIGNFIYENRVMNVIKRHLPMILRPACAAAVMYILWTFMHSRQVFLLHSDLPLTVSLSLFGVIYGIIAALAIDSTWKKYKEVSFSVVRMDKETFLALRDEKIPIMLHILLGTMAVTIQTLVMLINYENITTGRILVFSTAFFLCLIGLIAMELDDPKRSVWFQKRIPEGWLDIDVEDYFIQKYNNKERGEIVL